MLCIPKNSSGLVGTVDGEPGDSTSDEVHFSPPFGLRQGELYRGNRGEAKRVSPCGARRMDFSGGTGGVHPALAGEGAIR